MAQSFTTAKRDPLSCEPPVHRRVLVTGAAGNIGSYFAEHSRERYTLRLMVRPGDEGVDEIRPYGEVVEAELADLPRLKQLCEGIDTVLHLAADPRPSATWDSLLPNNIVGTYHMFVAAKAAGCRRVVYASSIHAVSGYPVDMQVKTTDPPNPGDLYGVTKCFGEALARYMAEHENVSAIAVRIGAFQPLDTARSPEGIEMLDAFVSRRDLNQLLERCIDAENIRFAIVHGLSNNRFKRMDLTDTRELLGYAPMDDLFREQPLLSRLNLNEHVDAHNVTDDDARSGLRNDLKNL